jgi:hypothetical protein
MMIASTIATGFFAVLHVSIILLIFLSNNNEVIAWQTSTSISSISSRMTKKTLRTIGTTTTTTIGQHHKNPSAGDHGPKIPSSSPARRELLFLIPKIAATFTTAAVIMVPHQAFAAAPPPGMKMTPDSARDQWKNAATVLDDLLQNWSTEKWAAEVGGGDNIRTKLGTQGTTSPLFQIEKVFKALRDSEYVDDFMEFQETADEFMDALLQADSLANSSNNKTGSGSQTPPAVFIEQSRAEVVKLQSIAKKMNGMVK